MQKLEIIENELKMKENELKELKLKISVELSKEDKLISVIFISFDQKIHYSMICKSNDLFSRLENELYKEYKSYKETENYFLVNGKRINRYNTLEQNGIKNSDIISLNIIEV